LATSAGAQTLSCPETLGEDLPSGWERRTFERVSIYNKDAKQEYDLAPDDERKEHGKIVQTWKLTGYRDMPLYLRCRYRGTDRTLTRELTVALKTCEFHFQLDKKGNVVLGNGAAKPEVKCQ